MTVPPTIDRESPPRTKSVTANLKTCIKVVIIDDHPVVRFGLRHMLGDDPAIEVAAELDHVKSLATTLEKTGAADVILLDLELEDTRGVEALRITRELAGTAKVIIYTSFEDEERIVQAAELGVDGYLLKGCKQRELLNAIHTVHSGGMALESSVAAKIMKHMNRRSRSTSDADVFRFSKREKQVLQLLAGGKTNREIGKLLYISESTVKFHMHAILDKLNASNRTEAVSIAVRHGIIELNSRE